VPRKYFSMRCRATRLDRLRDRLLDGLRRLMTGVMVNGALAARLPHSLNGRFLVNGEQLLAELEDVTVSAEVACTSTRHTVSYVLQALGLGEAHR
jgi:cysteine sulfinate desulfinase/cysteine desulfurase-like protein